MLQSLQKSFSARRLRHTWFKIILVNIDLIIIRNHIVRSRDFPTLSASAIRWRSSDQILPTEPFSEFFDFFLIFNNLTLDHRNDILLLLRLVLIPLLCSKPISSIVISRCSWNLRLMFKLIGKFGVCFFRLWNKCLSEWCCPLFSWWSTSLLLEQT
jgi:hypothetical protein